MPQTAQRLGFLTIALWLVATTNATAREISSTICPLVLSEERNELSDAGLALDLAGSELKAAEEIFKLVDGLWKDRATERMRYLAAKHNYDVARVEVERRRYLLERQEATVEQYRLACDAEISGEEPERNRRAIEEAFRRYREANCGAVRKDLEMAEVNLAFDREFLASIKDLRDHDVATRPDVINAERNIEMTLERLSDARERVKVCAPRDKPSAGTD